MSYLANLKKTNESEDSRWIVKYNPQGLVREVKLIYKPSEYYAANKHKGKHARPLHNKNIIIKILENDKELRKEKN
jgi:hypothetical protein